MTADSAYGKCGLPAHVAGAARLGWHLKIVSRPKGAVGLIIQPGRWVVERTFAWLSRCRVLGKDYEKLTESSRAQVFTSSIRHLVRRLAPDPKDVPLKYRPSPEK